MTFFQAVVWWYCQRTITYAMNFNNLPKYHFKISNLSIKDREFNGLPFGRQIEYYPQFKQFRENPNTKHNHFRKKGISFAAGLKKFKDEYSVDQYYCIDRTGPDWDDDSVEIWYTTK